MKSIPLFLFLFFSLKACSHLNSKPEFTLVHYNIKELSSVKLKEKHNKQLMAVKYVLKDIQPDILSINEIQYDLPNVPNKKYQTNAQNLHKLAKILEKNYSYQVFRQANTGNLAKKINSTDYAKDYSFPKSRNYADQNNFGIFPGQYSTGALSNIKIISVRSYSKLKWKEFNPDVNLNEFAQADGKPLSSDIELFDKSFIDALLQTPDGIQFHLILLHTVPAYHFGNKRSPNYERNRDQLRFLEWYITGQTDIKIPQLLEDKTVINSLQNKRRFIATGDWNTDINNKNNPGTKVLKRLFSKTKPWIDTKEMNFSNEGYGYGKDTFRLMLDYIITDKQTKIIDGKILHPEKMDIQKTCVSLAEGKREALVYRGFTEKFWKEKGKICRAKVPKAYVQFKDASDHYPLYLKFSL